MSNIIYLKIDVTKIMKDRLFIGNGGAKYLDAVCIPSANSQYGDSHMIVQAVTKEERLAGKRGPIIGNAKEKPPVSPGGETPFDSQQRPAPKPAPAAQDDSDEPPPF